MIHAGEVSLRFSPYCPQDNRESSCKHLRPGKIYNDNDNNKRNRKSFAVIFFLVYWKNPRSIWEVVSLFSCISVSGILEPLFQLGHQCDIRCWMFVTQYLCGLTSEENNNIRVSLQQFNQNKVCSTMETFLILTAIVLKVSTLFTPAEGNWYLFVAFRVVKNLQIYRLKICISFIVQKCVEQVHWRTPFCYNV